MRGKLFFAALAGWALTTLAAVDITTDTTLDADADWSDQGLVTVAAGATLDLNSHALKVSALNCAGTITSTAFYRRLAYIESTGAQWVDTGFTTTAETAIDFDFTTLDDNGNHAYLCGDWANNGHLLVANKGANNQFVFFGATGTKLGTFVPQTHFRFQTIPGGTKTMILSNGDTGAEIGSSSVALTHTGTGTLKLFSGDTSGFQLASYRFHHLTLTHQGTVVRDLVPVERTSDGRGGLLDLVNMLFYPSAGSADFVKGSTTNIGYAENDPTPLDPRLEFAVSSGSSFTRTGSCTVSVSVLEGALVADTDLRCWGTNLSFAGPIMLNGHRLSVATLAGATSFANTASASGYRQLSYIESTGAQWIDTGFTTTEETAIDLDFTTLADNGNHAYLCGDWAGNGHLLVANSGANNQFVFFGGTGAKIGTFAAQTHFRFQTVPGGAKTVILSNGDTGAEIGSASVALTHAGTGTLKLFSGSASGYQLASYRLHRLTLTHQGTVVRDLVPAERLSDGKVGLYDTVNKDFYSNLGTGDDFVKGAYAGDDSEDDTLAMGELYLEVPEESSLVNTVAAFDGRIRFIKAGAGAYTENRAQTNKGGLTLASGTFAFGADARALRGALTLAGGTLAITEGVPLAVTNGVTVTGPTAFAFTRTGLLGKKTLISGCRTALPLDQLTLTVAPSLSYETRLAQEDGQLLAVIGGATDVAKAVWSGATDGDTAKSSNWICTNADGAPVEDGVPGEYTSVEISGNAALQAPVGTTLTAGEVIVTNYTLAADCDWRGLGAYEIAGTVDLAGHKLQVANLSGTGTIRSGADAGYSFYRFKVDATGGTQMQISKLVLWASDNFNSDYPVKAYHWNETTFPSQFKTGYNPEKALDGNTATKWFDNRLTGTTKDDVWVTVEYAKPVALAGYQWYTGDDTRGVPDRNPVAWRLQGSNDNAAWTDLDVVTDYAAPAANKTLAYMKCLNANPGGDGGELHVDVAAKTTTTLSTVKLAGRLKLVKDGAGTLVVAAHGQTYCGGTEIAAGILKPGAAADDTLFGTPASTITVCEGAQFLDDYFAYGTTSYINWMIAGTGPDNTGAIRATKSIVSKMNNSQVAWGESVTLTGDATIAQDDYAFDFMAPYHSPFTLALQEHTLILQSAKAQEARAGKWPFFLFDNVQATGAGTLVVGENIQFYAYEEGASSLSGITLVVSEKGSFFTTDMAHSYDLPVSNLVYRSASTLSETNRTTIVLGRYSPESAVVEPKVQLGDATHLTPTLDLSLQTAAYDIALGGGLSFVTGSCVTIDSGTRNFAEGEQVLAWSAIPKGVSFVDVNRRTVFAATETGLYYHAGFLIIIR